MPTLLYNRTCYTLLESTLRIEQLVAFAKKYNYSSIAICDHNVMHGYMLFKQLCDKNQIHAIFGLEVDVMIDEETFSFLLFAKNDQGYHELIRCSSYIQTNQQPMPFSLFVNSVSNCMVVIPSEKGVLESKIVKDQYEEIWVLLQEYQTYFNDLYIGYGNPYSAYWNQKNEGLQKIAERLQIPLVALPLALYETEDDFEAYQVLIALKHSRLMKDQSLPYQTNCHLLIPMEFAKYPQSTIELTDQIAEKAQVSFQVEKAKIPVFPCPNHLPSATYLRLLCQKGLEKRFQSQSPSKIYQDRLQYELDIIVKMGFADYFLIVWDFILFARKRGIYVGPGRGSAAGSLVSYCLGITHIDPIPHHLLFERFLNPQRVSMPDIDTDFPDNRRDEVIEYVKEKYGNEHIAHIATFGTMAAKQALRDVGRVLDIPVRDIDMIAKTIPNVLKITLKGAYETSPRFKQLVHAEPRFQHLFQLACRLEGIPRHLSTHAAGIVMSDKELTQVVPLIQIEENVFATQYTMEYLEELGLIKMDFLGLRNLTIIDEIVQDVNQHTPLDILKIPTNDARTFELIRQVDTVGIFQLESDGMKALLKKIQPRNFEDIALTIALFRPGPMDNIPEYLKRRQNPQSVPYPHKDLEPILKETYGIMVYQEQIMQVSQVMAGFSLAKADILRKAMAKKKESELVRLKEDFIQGCIRKGYTQAIANTTYDMVLKFASYGFNKSHSVAYGFIAYQMAYLKANYPLYFYRSLLNSVIGSENKTYEYLTECKRKQIPILPPSVNHSMKEYVIEQNALRFPIMNIKNVGSVACEELLKERSQHGPFLDFYDFVARIHLCKVNRNAIERLIDAGALDEFHLSRKSMKLSLPSVLKYAELVKCDVQGQITIDLDLVSKPVLYMAKDDPITNAEWEKEALGFYFHAHPIEQLKKQIPYSVISLQKAVQQKGNIQVFVQVQRVKQHRTKKGDLMCFVSANDESMDYDFVIMPNIYLSQQQDFVKGNYLYIEGVINERDSCLVKKVIQYKNQDKKENG
ncbi:MAG: DNA polymerase III subunit alpha [Erysipelotrichaceae bacterium]|nr:DNA polymerase III subunit alpha [Erysipelotrichaceae bacterium]